MSLIVITHGEPYDRIRMLFSVLFSLNKKSDSRLTRFLTISKHDFSILFGNELARELGIAHADREYMHYSRVV